MVQNQLLQYDIELWWFGGLIYVIGSIMINLGSNLLRYSHEILRLAPEIERPPIWKRFWWMMGSYLMIFTHFIQWFIYFFQYYKKDCLFLYWEMLLIFVGLCLGPNRCL